MINSHLSLLSKATNHRFTKFTLVGVSGIPINMVMLYIGKEYLFRHVSHNFHGFDLGLNLALIFAIFCSIVNNFSWNHHWTWNDRKNIHGDSKLLLRFSRYAVASWLGVAIQLILTNLLTGLGLFYLISNLAAIGVASIANFMLSDKWAFRTRS